MVDYQIKIENCNSIDCADILIKKGSLNIKYGPNGLGKSTIARAIVSQARNDGSLELLAPFKGRGKAGAGQPKVSGIDGIASALVFDEGYVNQFAFQQDEVVKNSFDIFIKTAEYEKTMLEIEALFAGIKKAFSDNVEIEQTTKDLKELRDAFGKTNADGSIAKSSKLLKAYGSGNKIENIPEVLKPFESFIKSQDPSKWIGWQIKGNEFLKLGDTCPYCSTALPDGPQKDIPLAVAKEYDANAIAHLNTLKAVIERLGKYFSPKGQENLEKITKAKLELTAPEKSFLSGLKTDIEALIAMLEGLRTISFYSLRDVDEIADKIRLLKIDLGMTEKLDSVETRKVTEPINAQLEELIKQVGALKGSINKHKAKIKKAIEENQDSINSFLKSAGYKYSVVIIPEPDSYKMKLLHKDLAGHIDSASKHLSYGEKNAFALVLFMHQVLSDNPDIIVLDDPISSFDKNKKFAILHELFRGKASLRDRTTLMLTHDIEPAIDVIKSKASAFQGASPSATFLSSKGGIVTEVQIKPDEIHTFAKICTEILSAPGDTLIKSIYLRRYFEIMDNVGLAYNLLASLFKKRANPTVQSATESRDMTGSEKSQAVAEIKKHIAEFDYDALVNTVSDDNAMKAKFFATEVGYEKIQLFRIIRGKHEDDVISKFINESYHIENEYVMQLNPHKFEGVPEYVVDECSRLLKTA
ncbi:AAA family ATPase [Tardiphaga sp. 813_E8_N1_3]|uniref:AAA family ATPase n=1 Tax=Tardiphaga sp. 813_E8_N1_3 TaxID=3240760 RepID=UPI003F21EDFF